MAQRFSKEVCHADRTSRQPHARDRSEPRGASGVGIGDFSALVEQTTGTSPQAGNPAPAGQVPSATMPAVAAGTFRKAPGHAPEPGSIAVTDEIDKDRTSLVVDPFAAAAALQACRVQPVAPPGDPDPSSEVGSKRADRGFGNRAGRTGHPERRARNPHGYPLPRRRASPRQARLHGRTECRRCRTGQAVRALRPPNEARRMPRSLPPPARRSRSRQHGTIRRQRSSTPSSLLRMSGPAERSTPARRKSQSSQWVASQPASPPRLRPPPRRTRRLPRERAWLRLTRPRPATRDRSRRAHQARGRLLGSCSRSPTGGAHHAPAGQRP